MAQTMEDSPVQRHVSKLKLLSLRLSCVEEVEGVAEGTETLASSTSMS